MSAACFQRLGLGQFQGLAEESHANVARGHGRIEITRDGCDDVCVLISKAELDALERALEIFSQTPDFRSMCDHLASLASRLQADPGKAECGLR